MNEQVLFIACIFGAITLGGYYLSRILMNDEGGRLRDRLQGKGKEQSKIDKAAASDGKAGMKQVLQKIGQSAAEPFMPKDRQTQSSLRRNFGYAGIYNPAAMKVMQGCKVIFLIVGLALGYVFGMMFDWLMLGLPIGGLVGYLLPSMWMKLTVKKNQRDLTYGLADALDLMVVCVEAGLTIDAAMQRVGQEVALAHPALAREMGITHMETRVGLARSEALRNMGTRTGNQALQSLAAMLIQADRFGTSIASALRIHAESLRNNRQHAAEEMAAKASVKMSFPLVLFIFPATFIVLAGPTVIRLMESTYL